MSNTGANDYAKLCKICGNIGREEITTPRTKSGYYCKSCKITVLADKELKPYCFRCKKYGHHTDSCGY